MNISPRFLCHDVLNYNVRLSRGQFGTLYDLDATAFPDTMRAVFGRSSSRAGGLGPVLFWGSLWGIWEATVGHIIHLTRVPGLPGFIMFPSAFYFMSKAFIRSERYQSIFLTACVAAGLKLFDIFIPGQSIQAVINPAQAILLESLVVTGFYCFLQRFNASVLISSGKKRTPRG